MPAAKRLVSRDTAAKNSECDDLPSKDIGFVPCSDVLANMNPVRESDSRNGPVPQNRSAMGSAILRFENLLTHRGRNDCNASLK